MNDSIENLSVVIPVFNAEKHVEETIQNLISFFSEENISYEIILVNDNSTDSTATILTELKIKHKNIKIVKNSVNIGQDGSTLTGIQATTFQTILVIDDDFEFPTNSISILIKTQVEKNADVVYGIPLHNKSNFIRKIAHTISHQTIKLFGFSDASNYKLIARNLSFKMKKLSLEKNVNIDKFLLKNATNIHHVEVKNFPNNHSRYNLRKLVMKTLNFIFYSK